MGGIYYFDSVEICPSWNILVLDHLYIAILVDQMTRLFLFHSKILIFSFLCTSIKKKKTSLYHFIFEFFFDIFYQY